MDKIIEEKFWEHVEKTDFCWNWTGRFASRNKNPILSIYIKDNNIKRGWRQIEYQAKRISLELHNINVNQNCQVLNECKNKKCVKPNHLIHGDEARFWSKVYKPRNNTENECWIWMDAVDEDRYGKFTIHINEKQIDIRAHRYSWQLANNYKIKNKSFFVCHTCDNPICVNPNHLFLGDVFDNNKDRTEKGRSFSKLKTDEVVEIKKLLLTTISVNEISKIYKVDYDTIISIKQNKSWKHVKLP